MKLDNTGCRLLEEALRKERFSSCLVQDDGQLVYQYHQAADQANKMVKLNSITKSVLSLLVGMAIERGTIHSVDTPISAYFPNLEPDKQAITIAHLLTMTAGFEWHEFGQWLGIPHPMIASGDWAAFVLNQPLATVPGETMCYNSGCSQLLSAIMQQTSGISLAEYADKHLFAPLGIQQYRWNADSGGVTAGGFGLSMSAADAMKIGGLMQQQGIWGADRLISAEWISCSTRARTAAYPHIGTYGYHWWQLLNTAGKPYSDAIYFAMGFGGQFILVAPAAKRVIVFTSERYRDALRALKLVRQLLIEDPL